MYFSKDKQYWLLVRTEPHTCNHSTGETETGDHEFKASLDYTAKLCLKNRETELSILDHQGY